MRLFNEIAKRGVAVLLLAATAFASITYSLGVYDFTFIDRPEGGYDDDRTQEYLDTLLPGTNISDVTGGPGDVTTSPSTTPVTDAPSTSEQMSETTAAPSVDTTGPSATTPSTTTPETAPPVDPPLTPPTLSELLSLGYSISYADYNSDMKIAQVPIDVSGLDQFTLGNMKRVRMQLLRNYGEGHREVPYNAIRTQERPTLEVYMGYIIVDAGIGNVISGITDRTYADSNRVSIFTSSGKFIGIYPGDEVIPAYTRDRNDRPVFYYSGYYYYLDESTGRFLESDFNPDTDSRGLYFDYNPDFGKSDCKYQIFSTYQTITESFTFHDTTSYYTRYGVDSRLAEQIYLYYPKFANQIALTFDNGRYYDRLFAEELRKVKDKIASGELTMPPETTVAPETTLEPETTVDPETTIDPETPVVPDTKIDSETTLVPETTLQPENTETPVTSADAESTAEPETVGEPETTASPETAEPPAETTHVITDETTVQPPQPRSIIPGKEDADGNGIPDTLTVDISYPAYRFTYRASKPKEDTSKVTSNKYSYNEYITQTISWNTDYKYARAYNFSENRAYTVDANGIVKIINTNGNSAVYLYNVFKSDSGSGSFYHFEYYTEPFERDEYMLGHFYYDDGLIRMRVVERLRYRLNIYEKDYEVLLDTNGKKSTVVPEGYTLVSYSDSILLLERNGRYGYYHRDGYWVLQPIYTYAAPFIEGLAVVGYEDGVKGVVDTSGNIVIPFHYTSISNASTGIFACYSEDSGWQVFAKVSKK